jgi:hypothetical protein
MANNDDILSSLGINKTPYSPEMLDELTKQAQILSKPGLGDRQGVTPEVPPEAIKAEAMDRASNNLAGEANDEAARKASLLKAQASMRDQMGLPPIVASAEAAEIPKPPTVPGVPNPNEIPQGDSIFGAVSGKYQDLQKKGDVGPGVGGAGSGAGAAAQAGPTSPASKDYVGDLLKKLYGSDLDDNAIKAAQQSRNTQEMIGALGKATQGAGAAIARGRIGGGIPTDTSAADQVISSAGNQVSDIMARREAKLKGIETGIKMADLSDSSALRDAGSAVSQAYRNMAAQLNPKLAQTPGFNNMSAQGIKQLEPMVDMSIRMEMMKTYREQVQQQKISMDSAKAKGEMAKTIGTLMNRGTPMQATTTILAADKINDLFNAEPNPSKWNSSQVRLFNTETEKLAKGGIPSEHGSASLIPQNIASYIAKVGALATGDSIGTGQGAVISSLRPYINHVRGTSAQYLQDNVYKPTMTGYNRRVTPEDMEDYKRNIPSYIFPNTPVDLQQSNSGKIKVSNGHETLMIDPSDLPHAIADKYYQVQ